MPQTKPHSLSRREMSAHEFAARRGLDASEGAISNAASIAATAGVAAGLNTLAAGTGTTAAVAGTLVASKVMLPLAVGVATVAEVGYALRPVRRRAQVWAAARAKRTTCLSDANRAPGHLDQGQAIVTAAVRHRRRLAAGSNRAQKWKPNEHHEVRRRPGGRANCRSNRGPPGRTGVCGHQRLCRRAGQRRADSTMTAIPATSSAACATANSRTARPPYRPVCGSAARSSRAGRATSIVYDLSQGEGLMPSSYNAPIIYDAATTYLC